MRMILSNITDFKKISLLIMIFTTGCGNKPDLSRFNLTQGEQIYNNTCIACHLAGMSSAAPKIGNQRDWVGRIDKGIETLLDHSLNGFNDMPPRGGKPNLSDDEVKDAVAYMISKSW
ncbi:MAG: cytochrome c5 family protein [Thioploca sp.]|nr:cytochrome c5 family protein [Thioploca sp.]